ncbi:gliding motility-associated ABC transporter substrate-binding protein GldG [Bacteroidia bacterium]|nr:gliding motility-associated ABC transporter substrate-binding protein GldG [Bacteroidia bacterium]
MHVRVDLTADKRYTLSEQSRTLVQNLEAPVLVRVYLEGKMPLNMRPLQRSVHSLLENLQRLSSHKIEVDYVNLSAIGSQREKETAYKSLYDKGALPYLVQEKNEQGGITQMELFPTAVVNMGGKSHTINFLPPNNAIAEEENINNAIQNLEYLFANALDIVSRKTFKKIAFIEGHDELNARQTADITEELSNYFRVDRLLLHGEVHSLDGYDVAVVAKPRLAWSEADKLAIDQFVMRGGKMLWLVDAVTVHEDSLSKGFLTFGLVNDINLNDLFFRYGVRIHSNVVQDLQCAMIPVNVAPAGMPSKFSPLPWTYYPLLTLSDKSSITRSLNAVKAEFPSSIDTLKTAGIHKQVLLSSSQYALVKSAPYAVSLEQVTQNVEPQQYTQKFVPVAVLLSGEFTSIFKNRVWQQYPQSQPVEMREKSPFTQQVVVADGDVIRNDVLANGNAYPLGYDRYVKQMLYGNRDFICNVINFLTDEKDVMTLRNKVITLRLLDRARIVKERSKWLVINTLTPFVVLAMGGILFLWARKKRWNLFITN